MLNEGDRLGSLDRDGLELGTILNKGANKGATEMPGFVMKAPSLPKEMTRVHQILQIPSDSMQKKT